jgi:hypothetical protein
LITAHVNQSGQTVIKNTPQQPVSLDTGNKKKGAVTQKKLSMTMAG